MKLLVIIQYNAQYENYESFAMRTARIVND